MPLGPLMKCGHSAQGTIERNGERIPVCLICGQSGRYGYDVLSEELSDMKGRRARCQHYGQAPINKETTCEPGGPCLCEDDSQKAMAGGLAAFEHKPGSSFDSYNCGCR